MNTREQLSYGRVRSVREVLTVRWVGGPPVPGWFKGQLFAGIEIAFVWLFWLSWDWVLLSYSFSSYFVSFVFLVFKCVFDLSREVCKYVLMTPMQRNLSPWAVFRDSTDSTPVSSLLVSGGEWELMVFFSPVHTRLSLCGWDICVSENPRNCLSPARVLGQLRGSWQSWRWSPGTVALSSSGGSSRCQSSRTGFEFFWFIYAFLMLYTRWLRIRLTDQVYCLRLISHWLNGLGSAVQKGPGKHVVWLILSQCVCSVVTQVSLTAFLCGLAH